MKVESSSGGFVDVEIPGVQDVINHMQEMNAQILENANAALIQSAAFIKDEVQESIVGNRAEPKSVDTGNFANSITGEIIDQKTAKVYTDVEYAKFLEYGTIYIDPRRHFGNTTFRVETQVKEIFQEQAKNL